MNKINSQPFIPPFCPNPQCHYHQGGVHFFKKNGFTKTIKAPYINQRFKCHCCKTQFSRNTFDLNFRKRLIDLAAPVFNLSMNGMTNCSIARRLGVRERVVRNRLALLSRQAMLFEKERHFFIKEALVYDGFESFSKSQYSPCYINTLVGKDSLYTYHATFSHLNRKGRMTPYQKQKNNKLANKFGKYPSNSVEELTKYTLERAATSALYYPLTLHVDEHKTYHKVWKREFKEEFRLIQTSSKERRDTKNPLFAVNHLHLNYRHFLSSHRRETISFNKSEAALMDRILLMKLYKNFMRPKTLRQRRIKLPSPAMELGIAEKVMMFEEVFTKRRFRTHYKLDQVEQQTFERSYPYSRVKITPYLGL